MSFKDHFSGHAKQYGQFRPTYPAQFFSDLAALCTDHQLAWDCATGSGQAAAKLAKHFDSVIATDASAQQIDNAAEVPADNISYRVAPAEASGIEAGSVDLLTVAQALHWFDIPAFAKEAARVLKPRGVLAIWTYGLIEIEPQLDRVIRRFYSDIVGDFWPFEREMVENGYADIEMPMDGIAAPQTKMTATWSLFDLVGYLNTWSAVKAYEKAHGRNPLELVEAELEQLWGDSDHPRTVNWPLMARVWRKNGRQTG